MTKSFSLTVTLLTLAGTLPFLASAISALYSREIAGLIFGNEEKAGFVSMLAGISLLGYAISILSFMSGIRWGQELVTKTERIRPHIVTLAVLPAILGWLGLMMAFIPGPFMAGALFVLAAAFLLLLAWDFAAGYAHWYLQLRVIATLCASISLIAAGFGYLF